MRSGETAQDDLCAVQTVEDVRMDLEVVSDDIDITRNLTAQAKRYLRTTTRNALKFENDANSYQYIHGIDVDDHDDEYLPRSVGSDEEVHVGALDVTINLGEVI